MDYYRRMLFSPPDYPVYENYPADEEYLEKMMRILSTYPTVGVPREPTQIISTVFLGSTANAENLPQLKAMNIRYLLNCAPGKGLYPVRRARQFYPPETGIAGYEELPIEESEWFAIRPYFERAQGFIDYARRQHGNVLVYCPGVSRSGAIMLSYLIASGMPLLEATRTLKDRRRVALTNEGYMKDLIAYARERGMLDSDISSVAAPKYHRRINSYRINSAHLPNVYLK